MKKKKKQITTKKITKNKPKKRRTVKPNVGKLEDNKDVEGLIKALQYKKDNSVRRNAAWALERIGDERAVEPLIQALKDDVAFVREEAARALGEIGDARAVEPLIQAISDENISNKVEATKAILAIGKPALEPLAKAFTGKDKDLRLNAAYVYRAMQITTHIGSEK